jgi:hypothetical protein
MTNTNPAPYTGSRGAYLWLTTGQLDLGSLLRTCPQALIGKYIAITSHDSGSLIPTDEERKAGWKSRNEIAYSPQIQWGDQLPHRECGGFDEWYVFKFPFDLGQIWQGNVFEAPLTSGQVSTFANFLGFALHNPEVEDLTRLFWKQIAWIQPESYIADGDLFLTFVTRDPDLFAAVRQAIRELAPKSR